MAVFIDKYTDTKRFATNASTPDQPTYNPRAGLDDAKSRIIARKEMFLEKLWEIFY